MLEDRRSDLHVRDPYRNGVAAYERRPCRAEELPDDVPFSALFPAVQEDDVDLDAADAATPSSANVTTVKLHAHEGGILPSTNRLPTQS